MTALIDFFAYIGWAYDLRRAPVDMIVKRKERTGDQSEYTESNDRRHPLIHWILGLTLSASVLWILFAIRVLNHYLAVI
jgi:hypothetical protein